MKTSHMTSARASARPRAMIGLTGFALIGWDLIVCCDCVDWVDVLDYIDLIGLGGVDAFGWLGWLGWFGLDLATWTD